MHKNTKVTRPLYKFIKSLRDEGWKTKKIIREIRCLYDILVSESTVNAIKRSKNYKQYRLGWKKTRRPLIINRVGIPSGAVVIRVSDKYFGGGINQLDRKHWYSRISHFSHVFVSSWRRWLGL